MSSTPLEEEDEAIDARTVFASERESIPVLHIDDDSALAELVAEFLERKRDEFEITTATDPTEGLDSLRELDVDCIVCDYDMPEMNGLEVLDAVRDEYPELPFILFTGKGSEEVASDAISRGATDYLQKGSGTDQYDLLANRIENAVEQYRTRRKLERRERRLYALLENSNDRLSVLDEEGRYQFVSPAMERLMGHDPTELLGESGFEYVHPADRDEAKAAFEQVVQNPDAVHDIEYRYKHADGSWRWVESRGKNRLDDPAIEGIVVNSRDITARKERERELERTRARFRALTENTTLTVITIDDESTIRYANDAVADVFGYEPEELIGESLLTIMPDRFHDDHEAAVKRYLQEGTRQLAWEWIELPGRHKDGHEVPLGISFGEATIGGEEHRFTAAMRDITERKERERERQQTLDLLRDLYDVTTDTELSFEEKLDLVLELGCERLDLPYGFLTHIETDDGAEGEGTQRIVQAHGDHELLQSGESCPLDRTFCRETIRTDGLLAISDTLEAGWEDDPAYRTFELGCYIGGTVSVDDRTYGTLCFGGPTPREEEFTDTKRTIVRLMSRWVSYELERRRMTGELERQNERLQEFASILAHDLRNPLNVAEGRLDLVAEETDSEHLDGIANALDRMDTLIDDVLALAREGETVTETEPVDLAATVDQCWETVDTAAATLVVDTERTIYADRSRLRQLLENLVRNAVEHSSTGSRSEAHGNAVEHSSADVTITVGDLDDGFYVADDGPGIPEDERDEVFETGYTTSAEGTGFGLSIVREIAAAHDWTVTVTESEAGGARFEITGVEIEA